MTDLTRIVNERYTLRLAFSRQNEAFSNEHGRRIDNEINLFEQGLRAHVSIRLNLSASGVLVNHRFLPIEVDEYMESLARVDIDSLGTKEEEDSKCDICKESFGQPRGSCSPPITPSTITTTTTSTSSSSSSSLPESTQHVVYEPESESGQPVEEANNPINAAETREDERPEIPVKLECGHIFGEICLRRWISEGNSPTCPTCRRALNDRGRDGGEAVLLEMHY